MDCYDRLLDWTLQLTRHNHEQAEDLLHDGFVHFTLVRPNLDAINNIESYLFTVLKNLHLSQIRHTMRTPHHPRSLVDFESLRIVLRSPDLRATLQVHDELRLICQYACVRKESSKAGSVLILRFFRGYYPSELSKILRTPRQVIDSWLRVARREAKMYLKDPRSLTFMTNSGNAPRSILIRDASRGTSDLFSELKEQLSRARSSSCLSPDQLTELYRSTSNSSVECALLSHVASCSNCLDRINQLLGLPPLAERNPYESMGSGPKSKNGSPPEAGPSGSSNGARQFVRKSKEQAREVFEHRPEQLLFSANGFLLSAIAVDHQRNEHSLNISMEEKINFVEVFSEQNVRLLILTVEPPPVGLAEQSTEVDFSDGRYMKLTVSFSNHWPVLHCVYSDPLVADECLDELSTTDDSFLATVPNPTSTSKLNQLLKSVSEAAKRAIRFYQPATTATIVAAVILISASILFNYRVPSRATTAVALLQRSRASEELVIANMEQVIHQTVILEERAVTSQSKDDQVLSRHRIEVWQSPGRAITARRLYDDRGSLIAGEWKTKAGVQTLYNHSLSPRLQNRNSRSLAFDTAWLIPMSATEFSALIGRDSENHIEEHPDAYVINATLSLPESVEGLVRATLVLSRSDLHVTEETLVLRQQGEERTFKYIEISFERKPSSSVPESFFEVDPVLIKNDNAVHESRGQAALPARLAGLPPSLATPDLEVEILRLLGEVAADLDDQTTVSRLPDGRIKVNGIVETAERKAEIKRALEPVIRNPAVVVDVSTIAEALAKQPSSDTASKSVVLDGIEADANSFAAYKDLRAHLTDQESRAFASLMVDGSRQAMRHAWALRGLVNQFSIQDLHTLSPEGRAKLQALIRSHANALARESGRLRQQLERVLGIPSHAADEKLNTSTDVEIRAAILRLFDASSAMDRMVRASFTISPRSSSSSFRTEDLWRAIRTAERSAMDISTLEIHQQ